MLLGLNFNSPSEHAQYPERSNGKEDEENPR